jgi:hypothetical protein
MSIQRDPHLPPPEVCDWLLAQEWSEAIPTAITTFPLGGPGGIDKHTTYNHVYARAALGADEVFAIELPVEALAVLRADAEARKLDHETDQVNEAQPDPETDLLRRVLADAEQADISAFGAIGVLTTAATMMVSQCYDLTLQEPSP